MAMAITIIITIIIIIASAERREEEEEEEEEEKEKEAEVIANLRPQSIYERPAGGLIGKQEGHNKTGTPNERVGVWSGVNQVCVCVCV